MNDKLVLKSNIILNLIKGVNELSRAKYVIVHAYLNFYRTPKLSLSLAWLLIKWVLIASNANRVQII